MSALILQAEVEAEGDEKEIKRFIRSSRFRTALKLEPHSKRIPLFDEYGPDLERNVFDYPGEEDPKEEDLGLEEMMAPILENPQTGIHQRP